MHPDPPKSTPRASFGEAAGWAPRWPLSWPMPGAPAEASELVGKFFVFVVLFVPPFL